MRQLYFVGPWVDAACMGGLSILIFLYFRFGTDGYFAVQASTASLSAAAMLTWVVNYPHFAATGFRFYRSAEHVRSFPLTAYLVPALMALGAAACFAWPTLFAPVWAKVLILWSAYHYCGQNLGLTLIYARRGGLSFSQPGRWLLTAFLYSCFLAQYAEVEAIGGQMWLFQIPFPLLGLPKEVALALRWISYGAGILLLGWVCGWMRRERRALPWIIALPPVTHFVWTSLGAETFSFQALVPLFHGLQYLLIAWALEMREGRSSASGGGGSVAWRSARWGAAVVGTGALLFFGLPRLAWLAGFDLVFATGVFFITVQVHHFFVDGVIWKLRHQDGSSPLFQHYRAGAPREPRQ